MDAGECRFNIFDEMFGFITGCGVFDDQLFKAGFVDVDVKIVRKEIRVFFNRMVD
jgi:hypothetical protein